MKVSDVKNFDETLNDAEEYAVSEWEMGFVSLIRNKYEQYGDGMFISVKQIEMLERIGGGHE
jgi:hypothetical protein